MRYFCLWHELPVRCGAAIPCGYRGTFAAPMRHAACVLGTETELARIAVQDLRGLSCEVGSSN